MSRYEVFYAGHPGQALKISKLLKRPHFRPLLTKAGIDGLAFKDRVLVTSLLRRCVEKDQELANLISTADLNETIAVKNQRNIAQLTQPGSNQKSEWKLFKKLNSAQKEKASIPKDLPTPTPAVRSPRKKAVPRSDAILQKQGWFSPTERKDMEFSTVLRERAYDEAAALADKPENFEAFSPQMKVKSAAVMALLQKPFTHSLAKDEVDNALLIPAVIRNHRDRKQTEIALSTALPHLYPEFEDHLAGSPLACWMALNDVIDDEAEFSYAAEALIASYSAIAYNRITDRSITFDTFLLPRLEEILNKIRIWVDWDDECPPSALVALAHAAALVSNRTSFDFFIATLDNRRGIPPLFMVNLYDSFFNFGIHRLDAILSPDTTAFENSQLSVLDKKKKYLCLVETGARIQTLHHIEDVTANLTCGPVSPTDAVRFPAEAKLVQVEDLIPIYSTEDMEIGQDVDKLTEHYLNHVHDTMASAGIPERYLDAVEVTHATVFIGLYRDAISARICEKLIATASDYDGVILLAKTGRILGNMIAPAVKAVGRENVYLSLASPRSAEFFNTLKTMRYAAEFNTIRPVRKDLANPDAWIPVMGSWISATMQFHGKAMQSVKPGPYSIMTLEQINGYFDSYQALIRTGLSHSNVEVFTSAANAQLNDQIEEGGFTSYENKYEVRRSVMHLHTPDPRPWTTPLMQTIQDCFDGFDSPYLPQYREMILERAQSVFAKRLPQVMDAMSYFHARFDKGLPDYVFTAPNQHLISRAAAYCAKTAGVPVYDFLILANTNHPRYRPIIADFAYLYDPWYKEIYKSFFGLKEDQLRTSGPLFEYSERLTHEPNTDYIAPDGKTHIVFFSQSANFDNSKLMLESICQATKEREDIYITVKLHPHESPANIERYTQIAADNGIKDNIYVFHQGDAVALLNQADLVVQSFSNIGLDALLLKKPVITFKPKTDLKARIFLYEKDIGYVVRTKRTLTNKIKKFLKDPKDREDMQAIAETFAAENDHFLRGKNAARVMQSVQEDVVRFKAARES